MKLYIGDLDKKYLIKKIYEEFREEYKKYYYMYTFLDLDKEQLEDLAKKDYIREINGIGIKMDFADDYLEVNDTHDSTFLDIIFRIKLLDGLIDYNSPILSMIKVNEKNIKEIKSKMEENVNKMKDKGYYVSDAEFINFSKSKIIRFNSYDGNKYNAYLIWKENKLLEKELIELYVEGKKLKQEAINEVASRSL